MAPATPSPSAPPASQPKAERGVGPDLRRDAEPDDDGEPARPDVPELYRQVDVDGGREDAEDGREGERTRCRATGAASAKRHLELDLRSFR